MFIGVIIYNMLLLLPINTYFGGIMVFSIVHFSDIHLVKMENTILEKIAAIGNVFNAEFSDVKFIFFVVTGDIAMSGSKEEYEIAEKFICEVNSKFSDIEYKWIFVPGNHDCYLPEEKAKTRKFLVEGTIQNFDAIDENVIDSCCESQQNFNDFKDSNTNYTSLLRKGLFEISNHQLSSDISVSFIGYNTAWISQRKEKQGSLLFPVHLCEHAVKQLKGNFKISLLHHPLNWFESTNANQFQKLIDDTSDFVFTGHEHEFDDFVKKDFEETYVTNYVSGSVLQDSKNANISEFNIVHFNILEKKYKIEKYSWKNMMFSPKINCPEWKPLEQECKTNLSDFIFQNTFLEFLNEVGASYTHPRKFRLNLEDLYIYPDLKICDMNENTSEKNANKLEKSINSKNVFIKDSDIKQYLIVGDEKSGKTALCKTLCREFFTRGLTPIYICGEQIQSNSKKSFEKLMKKIFSKQYKGSPEQFSQLDKAKKVLIIDSINESNLNLKNVHILINSLKDCYSKILITANTFFSVEELLSDERPTDDGAFDDFVKFEILEFGFFLRNQLIEKWNLLGRETVLENCDLIRANDKTEKLVNSIVGNNLVPSYPLFLLTILQTIEAGTYNNFKESVYCHYYDFLIRNGLIKTGIQNEDIDLYFNYVTELSFYFFEKKIYEITIDKLQSFNRHFNEEYSLDLNFKSALQILTKGLIIDCNQGSYKFKYPYVFYFFVAQYLSNNISSSEIKDLIAMMCENLHYYKFSNIILFLTYHSKDPFVLDEILKNAKRYFEKVSIMDFDSKGNDKIKSVNQLLNEVPKLIVESINVKDNRERKNKKLDKIEDKNKKKDESDSESDFEESKVDFISNLNSAFKTIEILGQILKNYYGSLKGKRKYELCEELYYLGLRALNSCFELLVNQKEIIGEKISASIEENTALARADVEVISKRVLYNLFRALSFSFIKKISTSVGYEKLSNTYDQVLENNEILAIKLIDISIKLDFFQAFPYEDIRKIVKNTKGNLLTYDLIRVLVVHYIYMFPTDLKTRQRISNLLSISMKDQRKIEHSMQTKMKK